jgi:hypothetical protein
VVRRVTATALIAAAPLAGAAATARAAATPPAGPGPAVLATRTTADDTVTVVVGSPGPAVTGVPAGTPAAAVTAGRVVAPARVSPVWSDDAAVGLVVSVAGVTGPRLQAGLSGAAGLLLQLPAGSRSGVVADRRPPVFVAGPEVGAADGVQALSTLTATGQPDTSAALTLALDRLPARRGDRTVIVLYTSAPDAGGEPPSALGRRLREAGAVLAVVTSAPNAEYWTSVAQATGGLAVVAPADRPITAFDEVAQALRTRYVATFPRPAAAGAELRWTAGGTTSTLPLTIPATPVAAGGGTAAAGGGSTAPLVAGLVVVGLLAIGAAVLGLRRRRARARPQGRVEPPDYLVRAVPDGVRMFDIRDDAPKELSLFEPRSVRDARLAEAQAEADRVAQERADEQREAEEDEAREWAARRLADLQQRRSGEAAAAAEREERGG